MPKPNSSADQTATPAESKAPDQPKIAAPITLREFCRRASAKEHRVEAIGAFYARESRIGHTQGSEAEFSGRLAKFMQGGAR